MRNKRILLVSPYGNTPNRYFPLALGYLASNLPAYHTVRIVDGTLDRISADSPRFRNIIAEFDPDVVGVTAYSVTCHEALRIAKVCKTINPKIATVLGGPHPTTFPELLMQDTCIDYVFRGESELSFPIFLEQTGNENDFSSVKGLVYRHDGVLVKNEIETTPDLDKIKIPDYRALRLDEYLECGYFYGGSYARTAPLWVTRGCPYQCAYCSAYLINGRKLRAHSVDYVMRWIDCLYQEFRIRQFSIIDDNFTFDLDYAKEFCRTVLALKAKGHFDQPIRFTTPNGIRMERIDDELLNLMKSAGWDEVGIAPESGSRRTLKRMHKHIDPDKVPKIVDRIKQAGLDVRGYFMLGYPGETPEDIRDTIRLIRQCRFDGILMGRFFPIPGTPVFDELVRDGEITADYVPSDQNIARPFQNERKEGIYTPRAFPKGLNLFYLTVREHVLLAFRNPHSITYFIKYNGGILNIVKRLLFAWGLLWGSTQSPGK